MTVYASRDVQMALLRRWIDRGLRFDPEASRWPLEIRGLREAASREWRAYVIGGLCHCGDTLPDAYCDPIRIPRGSTYGEAARKMWREDLGEEDEPVASQASAQPR
jgi:hypothetical protein